VGSPVAIAICIPTTANPSKTLSWRYFAANNDFLTSFLLHQNGQLLQTRNSTALFWITKYWRLIQRKSSVAISAKTAAFCAVIEK